MQSMMVLDIHIRFAHLLVHELDFIDGKKQSEEPRVISIVIYGCIDKKSILTTKMTIIDDHCG